MSPGEETAVAYATNTLGFTSDEGEGENTKRAITLISFSPSILLFSPPSPPHPVLQAQAVEVFPQQSLRRNGVKCVWSSDKVLQRRRQPLTECRHPSSVNHGKASLGNGLSK